MPYQSPIKNPDQNLNKTLSARKQNLTEDLSGPYQDHIKIQPKPRQGLIKTSSKQHQNRIKAICSPYQKNHKTSSKPYDDNIRTLSKLNRDPISVTKTRSKPTSSKPPSELHQNKTLLRPHPSLVKTLTAKEYQNLVKHKQAHNR